MDKFYRITYREKQNWRYLTSMSNTILRKKIDEQISKLLIDEKSIIVLKGIPLEAVTHDYKTVYMEDIVNNKIRYFYEEIVKKRRFISYEELLLLNSFILDQYSKIYVLNNNLYINQYPLDILVNENTRKGLLVHFEESENEYDNTFIGDISPILELYNSLQSYNGYLIGSYCNEIIPINNKIKNINLFDLEDSKLKIEKSSNTNIIELEDESDYIKLIKFIFEEPDEVYIKISNYQNDLDVLLDHLKLISYYWQEYTDLFVIQELEVGTTFEHRDQYNRILKEYWGYDSFLDINVYNLKKLEQGKKQILKVSQEQIISDLVTQTENAMNSKSDYRDIFVTAPTGAGKSAMFQVPAIYLAEKYNLLTIVVSPLIGLMNDQVDNLEKRNYKAAKTINSDISPIIKQEIIGSVSRGEIDILYLSPETLLARSDVEQLIGNRTIGMIIIDEAHIVTTWGKQFRPDYWYLGEHIRKLRTKQKKNKGKSFVIGTFTATAIYRGVEDMYEETRNSLHLIDPITYLGYVKRNDIEIVVDDTKNATNEKTEYEFDKFNEIEGIIKRAHITNKKTLIYFPTVSLIKRCWEFLLGRKMVSEVTLYHGQLPKEKKDENYRGFKNSEKLVMLATKAFGMGIDIDDIELVVHFAPTGNVCDYVQEIGRAARKRNLSGEAYYHYNSRDFKFINRLHGISTIKKYQIVEVIKKLNEIYSMSQNNRDFTKKRNAMLIDAQNFSYIFDSISSDNDDNINKVKTALLLIQKDYEARFGYSPIAVRPIPLFSIGYFSIDTTIQKKLNRRFKGCVEEIYKKLHICKVNLQLIWNVTGEKISFPQFKYLIYSRSEELEFNKEFPIKSAFFVKVNLFENHKYNFRRYWEIIKKIAHVSIVNQEYIAIETFVDNLENECHISRYKAQLICDVIFASMDSYRGNFSKTAESIHQKKELNNGVIKYQFKTAIESYFSWVEKSYEKIISRIDNNFLYAINENEGYAKELNTILGLLEILNVLTFEMSGGANSQLYIYVNQIRVIQNIINNPFNYENRLLNMVNDRHLISVKMLTYLYTNKRTSQEIWDILENYFLGIVPEEVKEICIRENPNICFRDRYDISDDINS